MVASASSSGFNTLFVQIADQSGPAAPTFDPITDTITQAHAAGLRVHAWIDVIRVAPAGELPFARDHVIYQHPEWLMVPRALAAELLPIDVHSPDYLGRMVRWTRTNDRIDGVYLSPAVPEAASYLAEMVRDVLQHYPVDGVYLDHVGYPAADFDYGARSIAAFRDFMRGQLPLEKAREPGAHLLSGAVLDPRALAELIPDFEARGAPLAAPVAEDRVFFLTRTGRIKFPFTPPPLTSLVARLRSTVKSIRPEAIVSAAVTSDAESAERDNLQDWRTWAANGFVDALCPMVPAADVSQVAAQLSQARLLAAGRPLWAGIGANRLSQRETIDGIAAARRAGAQGIVLFSYDSLVSPPKGSDFLSAIGRGAFAGS